MIREIDYRKLGLKIKSIRQSRNLTQDNLAEMVGCNTSHISNIENNYTKASLNVLLSVANALNTSIDSLLAEQYNTASDALLYEIMQCAGKMSVEKKEKILKIMEII